MGEFLTLYDYSAAYSLHIMKHAWDRASNYSSVFHSTDIACFVPCFCSLVHIQVSCRVLETMLHGQPCPITQDRMDAESGRAALDGFNKESTNNVVVYGRLKIIPCPQKSELSGPGWCGSSAPYSHSGTPGPCILFILSPPDQLICPPPQSTADQDFGKMQ